MVQFKECLILTSLKLRLDKTKKTQLLISDDSIGLRHRNMTVWVISHRDGPMFKIDGTNITTHLFHCETELDEAVKFVRTKRVKPTQKFNQSYESMMSQ